MKIAQVNVYFSPFTVGGAEWYVHNISKRLVKMGHEVHVYTADKYSGRRAPREEVIDGIFVHRIPLRLDLSYRAKMWKGLGEAISKEKFDFIHTYDYAQPHSKIALDVAKREGIPSAVTVFDVHSMIPRPFYKQIPIKAFEKFYAGGVLNSADRILVRAPMLIEPLVKMGAKESKIIVTPSGINEQSLGEFDGKNFLEKYKIQGRPVILFLGRLNPLKGPQHILAVAPKILEKFPDASFVFVGPDQSDYKRQLLVKAESANLKDHLYFTGPIYDFKEKMEAYASCDVFVLPTTYEGTSQAIFEAMSQGKPIVSTNTGGIPSQITSGEEGLLIPYGDDEALAKSILQILGDSKEAARLGGNAREKVRSYTYPILASKIEEIYLAALGKQHENAIPPLG